MKSFSFDELPSVSEAQMRDVDRLMIDDFHISLLQMMENAGRNLAELCVRVFAPASVVVLAGGGGNGGGGLVAARHPFNRGVPLTRGLFHPESAIAPGPPPAIRHSCRHGRSFPHPTRERRSRH